MNTRRSLGFAAAAATITLVLAQPATRADARAASAAGRPLVIGHLMSQVRPGGPAVISRDFAVSTSTNWSGYAVTGGTFTYVHGSWTVPAVTCASGENSQSSTWVGLDGWGSDTVEQLGSTTGCIFGVAAYFPWTEMYPALPVPLNEVMRRVMVAPVSRTVRRIPSEVALGPDEGLPVECAASFDNLQPFSKSLLVRPVGGLDQSRVAEMCRALRAMADC